MCLIERWGLTHDLFNRAKSDYPSLQYIKNHSTQKTHRVMVINLQGIFSHQDPREIMYKLVIDARDFPQMPKAYVYAPEDDEIEHSNIYRARWKSLFHHRPLSELCLGDSYPAVYNSHLPSLRFGAWLYQVHCVLNNPNPDSAARPV